MPTEAAPPSAFGQPPSHSSNPHDHTLNKCIICGLGSSGSSSTSPIDESVILLGDSIERICGGCARRQDVGLGLRGVITERAREVEHDHTLVDDDHSQQGIASGSSRGPSPDFERIMNPSADSRDHTPPQIFSSSLPSHHPRPWATSIARHTSSAPINKLDGLPREVYQLSDSSTTTQEATPPNPLLDITKARVPSIGRGALYPGSIFKGTQTSGRSAYEVEVQILDVNMAESSVSGYLSISHLTDSHPHLTTFFTGEIIGPKYGFITGPRYSASEHDDLRHWGRFEQFRRPATRADIIRPELLFRDPIPDRSRGETMAKERDFVFLRIKERFLVPDHKVRDISGASFAGFYYAMVDLSPNTSTSTSETPYTPMSPSSPNAASSTHNLSRQSYFDRSPRIGSDGLPPQTPTTAAASRRRESSAKLREGKEKEGNGEATIRGYYFHSLNQEPFQELFLSHVPARSSSTMELR